MRECGPTRGISHPQKCRESTSTVLAATGISWSHRTMGAHRSLLQRARENSTGHGSYLRIQVARLMVTPRVMPCRDRRTLLKIMSGLSQGKSCTVIEKASRITTPPTLETQCARGQTIRRTMIHAKMSPAAKDRDTESEITTKSRISRRRVEERGDWL